MRKLTLKIEDLEERIAPSFVFDPSSTPGQHANPIGGQGGLEASFGPHAGLHPNLSPWGVHTDIDANQGQAHLHTPLDFGNDE